MKPNSTTEQADGPCPDGDSVYFSSYAHVGIHAEMIKDSVRTERYKEAIERNAGAICDRVVLDVGCGTGILSIFCARVGARHVYAVDASEIAKGAQRVVEDNGLAGVITVIHGKVEDVELPEKVDVIVSEWMGYMLVYESMLDSVLIARDKWLKPGGLMLPSEAALYIAPITDSDRFEDCVDFWADVHGINMSALIPAARKAAFDEPSVRPVTVENVLTWPALIQRIDCGKVTVEELQKIAADFSLTSMIRADLHGFVVWFDVFFPVGSALQPMGNGCCDTDGRGGGDMSEEACMGKDRTTELEAALAEKDSTVDLGEQMLTSPAGGRPVGSHPAIGCAARNSPAGGRGEELLCLSTAPEAVGTHWQQTVLYIDNEIPVDQDQAISGSIVLTRNNENPRFVDISLMFDTREVSGQRHYTMK